jgi:CRP-like cAMP-binding protein
MRLQYLTANDWNLLRSRSHSRTFSKGEAIIHSNSRPTALFILKKGSATVEVTQGTVIARLAPGDICGEMAFIENNVASASVLAAEPETEAELFELPEVSAIFSSYPHLEARFYKSLALLLSQRLRRTSSELAKSIARK